MTKKIVAIILAAIMVTCLIPTVAMAASVTTGTITAYDAEEHLVGTYTTIDSAASAAGVGGTIEMSAGDFYFNSRQTIAVNHITLHGATNADGTIATRFITGDNYVNASQTNRKALLTIAATGVTVENIAFDGGEYGRTLVPVYNNKDTEFSVVRVNSGSATFNNVSIEQSERTLLTIGTSSSSATVTAYNFVCKGNVKPIPESTRWNVFADVDVEDGTLTVNSGAINAFLQKNSDCIVSLPDYHYNLKEKFLGMITIADVTTTAEHLVYCYQHIDPASYTSNIGAFRTLVCQNIDEGESVYEMVFDIYDSTIPCDAFSLNTVNGLMSLLDDAKNSASGDEAETLDALIELLDEKN